MLLAFASGCDSPTGEEPPGPYQDLVAGEDFTCARSEEARWYCWGQYWDREEFAGETPTLLRDDPGLVTMSAGKTSACGLTASGRAYCWGYNVAGALGLGSVGGHYPNPVPVETDLRFDALANASDPNHMCALAEGRAYCWGNNAVLQLGAGIEQGYHPWVEPVLGGHIFDVVAIGWETTCALTPATDVYCWGDMVRGPDNELAAPERIAEETGFDTLVAAHGVRCGLGAGSAYCHGYNGFGLLGTGDTLAHEGFVEVAGGHEFKQLSGGDSHFCGITTDDAAYCWGKGGAGQLGNGSRDVWKTPVPVNGGHRFQIIAAGGNHTCGLTTAGAVYCWGLNSQYQLGNQDTESRLDPTSVAEAVDP